MCTMGFLDSLFGRKREPARPVDPNEIKDSVDSLTAFCGDVKRHVGEEVFAQDGMEKQVLSAYAFGGVNVLSQQRGFSAPQVHAMALALLHKFFGYSAQDSAAKAQALIDATGDRRSSLNAIIHRGIDGFLAWQNDPSTFDAADLRDVLATLRRKPPA
jgi:hypothetical protein